jgi:Xaa-Pro aminopeptidase
MKHWARATASVLAVIALTAQPNAASDSFRERRSRVADEFKDGLLLVRAETATPEHADGFRQSPVFYYLTGLQDLLGAILVIDGRSGDDWLFLPPQGATKYGVAPEVTPGPESERRTEIAHILDWTAFSDFLGARLALGSSLYFAADADRGPDVPPGVSAVDSKVPAWLQLISQRWPSTKLIDAGSRLGVLMEVQSQDEQRNLRLAAKATVSAFMTGLHEIRPKVRQRSVEAAVENACWTHGAHGASFWPWAMAGSNGVFPKPFASFMLYDHLDSELRAGDLVRLDVGCEWNHYQGDLGRTVPVSGRFTPDQREVWSIFVSAYFDATWALRGGTSVDQVFRVWAASLMRSRASTRSALAQRAIAEWTERKNVPFWQVHTINLSATLPSMLRPGMTIALEPIASIGGQGYYLEDMFLITMDGAQLLTPGVPYSAQEIEKAMR